MKELFERYYSLNKINEACVEKAPKTPNAFSASNITEMSSGSNAPNASKMSTGAKTSNKSNTANVSNEPAFMGKVDTPEEEMMCMDWLRTRIGLANAYVPFQEEFVVMGEENSLVCGTVFPALAMPYKKGSKI
ncbi:MAG: spore coat associated protein CotJA [Lachnospiraceae bacterium]|nr:spore coat associated protein CotJA [Lachnospiraceae bacterium]